MKIIKDTNIKTWYIKKHGFKNFIPDELMDKLELFLFKRNEYICRTNDKLHYIFFFVEGKAKAYTILGNGKSFLHVFYRDFEVIGDVEFNTKKMIYSNVQAITDTYCIAISLDLYYKQLFSNLSFLHFIALRLSLKLEHDAQKDSVNLCYPLENRLASYIINTQENLIFDDNLTEVSELLATSYRHLIRTLQKFCKDEYLYKSTHGYIIKKELELQQLGKDVY